MTAKGPDHVSRGIRIPKNLEDALQELADLRGISFNALVEEFLTASWIKFKPLSSDKPPAVSHHLMQYFTYQHLPPALQVVSKPFGDLASTLDATIPNGGQKDAGMQKLLEAKDCMVRANLPQRNPT